MPRRPFYSQCCGAAVYPVATIVVAGSIPGATRTLAVAIYGYAETGQDDLAVALLLVSVAIAFVALWTANRLVERRPS